MTDEIKAQEEQEDLKRAVIRICPACGIVNPAGPSETCPHLQLARFNGLDPAMETLLSEVAKARNDFQKKLGELKISVLGALRIHSAEIEATQKMRPSDMDQVRRAPKSNGAALALENPKPSKPKPKPARKRSRSRGPVTVNPRQLELIALEPPKGDA